MCVYVYVYKNGEIQRSAGPIVSFLNGQHSTPPRTPAFYGLTEDGDDWVVLIGEIFGRGDNHILVLLDDHAAVVHRPGALNGLLLVALGV